MNFKQFLKSIKTQRNNRKKKELDKKFNKIYTENKKIYSDINNYISKKSTLFNHITSLVNNSNLIEMLAFEEAYTKTYKE